MELTFRDYEPADRAIAIQLLAQGRHAAYRRTKRAIFDWQSGENPHADGESPFLIGTVESEQPGQPGKSAPEIVATNGFMPARILYQGKSLQSCWSCDTFVSSKFRGHGFGSALIRRVSARAPVMLGYGISDMSDPIFERQGWLRHPKLAVLFLHVRDPGLKGAMKRMCSRVAASLLSAGRSRQQVEVVPRDEDFGPEVDELWRRSAPSYFSAVERDAAYLNWKYRRHPLQRYSWYAAYERGTLRGLVVARHDRESSVIVDYCGPARDEELMTELVRVASADMISRGTLRVQCETTHAPMLAALRRLGFIGSRYQPRFRVRSNLPGDTRALEGWFLMPGDSDGDLLGALGSEPLAAPAEQRVSPTVGAHARP
jgi:hypothetical protein